MDSKKKSFKVLRTQSAEIHLKELQERLELLCITHDTMIQQFEELIGEIEDVSSYLLMRENFNCSTNEKIERLSKFEEIKNSDAAHENDDTKNTNIDIKSMLEKFERLSFSQLDFHKVKESLGKVQTFFNVSKNSGNELKKLQISTNIRQKIDKLSHNNNQEMENCGNRLYLKQNQQINSSFNENEMNSNYVSCCSSFDSLYKNYQLDNQSSNFTSLSGYDGDEDSHFNMLIAKEH
ncbi:uncharacterized protein LOC142219726 isoform X2 [Haematobia irritans]|uniref:uncharacterized protein LOC142219726 isoform X2 n=1 Tax=Haematobia irritans TaxID=7368 RepID=UPI003F509E69